MKKTRKAHLWIGLIASIFIFIESITGLLMNEPWLIGQTQMEGGRGNFQQGQMPPNFGANQTQGQTNGQANSGTPGQDGTNSNTQFPGRGGFSGNGGFRGAEGGTGSFMSIVRGLHEGRIGTTNVKWLVDLVAIAMIILTGTGIYLSTKVLAAERKRNNRGDNRVIA